MNQRPSERDYIPMFGLPVAKWHSWFAWYPVDTADRGTVWLRRIWRRRCQTKQHLYPGGGDSFFQYAVGDDYNRVTKE